MCVGVEGWGAWVEDGWGGEGAAEGGAGRGVAGGKKNVERGAGKVARASSNSDESAVDKRSRWFVQGGSIRRVCATAVAGELCGSATAGGGGTKDDVMCMRVWCMCEVRDAREVIACRAHPAPPRRPRVARQITGKDRKTVGSTAGSGREQCRGQVGVVG